MKDLKWMNEKKKDLNGEIKIDLNSDYSYMHICFFSRPLHSPKIDNVISYQHYIYKEENEH
jgi:hypothetical protein